MCHNDNSEICDGGQRENVHFIPNFKGSYEKKQLNYLVTDKI